MQGDTLFISDLHLCESRPHITSVFLTWLAEVATQADALYILGDFFEYWAGDDAMQDAFHRPVLQALQQLTQHTHVLLMHGNRDFLIREAFAQATGVQLIADPLLTTMHGQRVLLSHGDALCTDDVSYMAFRNQVRQPAWQAAFLAQSLAERKAFIAQARARSETEKSQKEAMIMDVNAGAVTRLLREHDYPPILIHGHTHRPNRHVVSVDGHSCERWVLGDWYEQGSYLCMNQHGQLTAMTIPG